MWGRYGETWGEMGKCAARLGLGRYGGHGRYGRYGRYGGDMETLVSGTSARTRSEPPAAARSSSSSAAVAASAASALPAALERAADRILSKSAGETFQSAPLEATTARTFSTASASAAAALVAASPASYADEMRSRSSMDAQTAASSYHTANGT